MKILVRKMYQMTILFLLQREEGSKSNSDICPGKIWDLFSRENDNAPP